MPLIPDELIEAILDEMHIYNAWDSLESSYLSTIALLSHSWRMYANTFRFAVLSIGDSRMTVRRIKLLSDLIRSEVWKEDEDIAHNVQKFELFFEPENFIDIRFIGGRYVNTKGPTLASVAVILRTIFCTPISPSSMKYYYGRLRNQDPGYCFHFNSMFGGITKMEGMGDLEGSREMIDAIETICTRPYLSSLIMEKLIFVPKATCLSPHLIDLRLSKVKFDTHYRASERSNTGLFPPFNNLRRLSFDLATSLTRILDFESPAPPLLTELVVFFEKRLEYSSEAYKIVHYLRGTVKSLTLHFKELDERELPDQIIKHCLSRLTTLKIVISAHRISILRRVANVSSFPNPLDFLFQFLHSMRPPELHIELCINVAFFYGNSDQDPLSPATLRSLDKIYTLVNDTVLSDYLSSNVTPGSNPNVTILLIFELYESEVPGYDSDEEVVLPNYVIRKYEAHLREKYTGLDSVKGVNLHIKVKPAVLWWWDGDDSSLW